MRLLLALLLLAPTASANMSNPVQPGTPAGEPSAALAGLRVARETLTLDLRPLVQRFSPAVVEAVYRIVNTGEARVVPLDFLALGGDLDAAQVWLDDQPVPATRVDTLAVPPSWYVADQTPALDGDAPPFEADTHIGTPSGLRFAVMLPPGQHTIRVRYHVQPGAYDSGDHPNRVWQLAYSLAPARLWAGFGQLDITVLTPDGWDVATSLPLRTDGDGRLVGRFPGVPGDVLAVSARAPAPTMRVPIQIAGWLAALALVGFFGWISGRLAGRAGKRAWAALPGSILGGILAAAALVITLSVAADLGDSSAYGYGTVLGMMFLGGPLAAVVGSVLAQALATITARRERARRATA